MIQKFTDQPVNVNDVTRISKGTSIKGDVVSETDIRVDGAVDGTVYSKGKVVVGETATLTGNLLCSNLDFWGKMDGAIYVKDTLSIKSAASVTGNIHVNKIQVEMGAQINGNCRMISEQEFENLAASIVKGAPAPASKPASASAKKEN
jgi:cytoskeletal protein CcmA (bactofilin family)